MPTAPSISAAADFAAQLAAARVRAEKAEAALAQAQARVAALEGELVAAAGTAQRHHAQLVALVQRLHVGLVLVDHKGQIQFVNQHFWELFGLVPVANPGPGDPCIPPAAVAIDAAFQDPAAFTARAWALHKAGQTVQQEEFVLADGRIIELDYLVLDQARAGRLICYRDVTERHRRDVQLRTLAYFPQHNPNPVLRVAATGEVVYTNPAAAALLQALATDALGDLYERMLALVHAALGAPVPHRQELTVAGQHYLFTAMAVPGRDHVTLYLTDMTAQRQVAQQLAQQRTFYESILEQVPVAVAVFDAQHRYLFVNPVMEPDPVTRAWMLGKTSTEACQRRQRPAAVARQREAAFAEALRGQRAVSWDEQRANCAGVEYLLVSYQPVPGPTGTRWVIATGVDITERKLAEAQVAEQREFYESALNLLPVNVAVFDAQFRYLFVNPAAEPDPEARQQMIGQSQADYQASPAGRPAGLAEQRLHYFAQAMRTRQDVSWEELRPGPQLILQSLRPVFAADGRLRLVVGSGIDITARYEAEERQRQAQALLQEQQAFVRRVVDALPDALYIVGPDGRILFSNAAYAAAATQSAHAQPAAGKSAAVLDEVRQVRALSELVRATQQPLTQELPFTLSTGEKVYYQIHKRPMRLANGQLGVLAVSTDVTAVKQARQALEQREKQYHDLVHYSQALICTLDARGRLLTVNPAIEQLLGRPATQLVGHFLHEALPPEHRTALREYLESPAPASPTPQVMTILIATGERRYLNYYAHRVAEPGQPPYVVASGYDVTAGVLARRALQQAKQEAEDNARAKEAFLARMSHEIRTPLNGVLGMATLLQKTPLTAPQAEYLHTMQHAGRHLLALLNDVLDMAKITGQHLQLDHAPFDLAVVLHGAGQTVAALAEAKGLELTVGVWPPGLAPRVLGDAYRLHQVLLNLLGNAIKFTARGHVKLGADVVRDAPGALTVRFWVEDTGIGIAPEQQDHIFEAFAQASADTGQHFGGTGLGLAISEQLVAQMGGTLRLSSAPGHGTTFAFQLTLPRPAPPVAQAPPPAAPAYDGLQGLRVLLAEDNPVNQFIAVVILERWGVQVQAVANGLDALDYLRTQPFEAALLDIRMPGLSGVAVTAAIRQHPDPARAAVPIIALTANAFDSDRAGYLAAGMNACLTKPYEEAALYQLLVELCRAAPGPGAP
ncbi:PAS domain-containing protein [Hymenobacter caeli]|uniref:histidine kinase n=1 Tax=Hymenobacter caeli TaxID=2735894 RepID=A0ABX2FUI1_9BACT|nr:PAS domain-containing protein [Hymenobacter caeli]NRT20681.1 PAS domain S-box-containing protein [Hymenobacter caeli]